MLTQSPKESLNVAARLLASLLIIKPVRRFMWLTRKPASGVNLPGGLPTAPSPAPPDLPAAIVSPRARAPVPRSAGAGDEVRSDHDHRQSMQRTPRSEIRSPSLGRTADRAADPPGRAAARKPAIWSPDLKPRTGSVRSHQGRRATDEEPSPAGPRGDLSGFTLEQQFGSDGHAGVFRS